MVSNSSTIQILLTAWALMMVSHWSSAQTIRTDGAKIRISPTATIVTPGSISIQGNGGVLNSGTVYLKGDWTNSGQGLLDSLPGTVDFNGNVSQMVGGNNITTFAFLRLSNPSGMLLSNNLNVGQTLIFNDGRINTGPYEVRMIQAPANAIVGANASRYINGNLRVAFDSTAFSQYKYEIGSTVYAPVQIRMLNVTDPGTLLAYTNAGPSSLENSPSPGASGIDPFARVDRHWSLSQSGMAFQEFEADFDYALTPSTGNVQDYIIRHRDPALGWLSEATSNNGTTASGVLSDGIFVIGELANTAIAEGSTALINLYPNPSRGKIYVNGLEQGNCLLSVSDMTGRTVFETFQHSNGTVELNFEALKLSAGTYVLKAQSTNYISNIHFVIQ